MEKTCFDCRYADIDPGSPDVYYLSNGDPGFPGEPPCAYCQDPLAGELQEKYSELLIGISCVLSRMNFPTNVRYKIECKLYFCAEDFAQFCPMFHQFDQNCKICGEIHHNRDISLCNECISKDPWI